MTKDQLALEEYKLVQAIIARQSDHSMRIRNWMILMLAGFSVAALKDDIGITWWAFLGISFVIIIAFFLSELMVRSVHNAALNRIEQLESYFHKLFPDEGELPLHLHKQKNPIPYIHGTLVKNFNPLKGNKEIGKLYYLAFYALMVLIIIGISITMSGAFEASHP
ncbi:MAG TPA: hypothetical protein ENJ82_17925 [Bacteroidetes bacterium]|nr:hypothetical protein [Bacteroidota bacterium]